MITPMGCSPARTWVLGLVLAGCDQVEPADDAVESRVPRAVQDAFSRSCIDDACHDRDTPQAGLDLTPEGSDAVFDLVRKGLPVVRIGDVNGSAMGLALQAQPPTDITRMPLQRDDHSLTDAAIILAWIAGAEMPMMVASDESTGG